MRNYVSDYWNDHVKGHSNYDFVDVAVNDDSLLFIDPVLIEIGEDDWCYEANKVIQSFFDLFYHAYKTGDASLKGNLLAHAQEQNGTRLGYGRGDNGRGNSLQGLLNTFIPLERLVKEIQTIGRAEDLPVFLPGFAEDKLSDLLTNILHGKLNEFTLSQMKKYGVECNAEKAYWTWDSDSLQWVREKSPSYFINQKELLVVPKNILRGNFLFSTGQYFNRIILERVRMEGGYVDENGKLLSKKDVVASKRYSGEHWQYDETVRYTREHNDALEEYHQNLPSFYAERGNSMQDDDLDDLVYEGR